MINNGYSYRLVLIEGPNHSKREINTRMEYGVIPKIGESVEIEKIERGVRKKGLVKVIDVVHPLREGKTGIIPPQVILDYSSFKESPSLRGK